MCGKEQQKGINQRLENETENNVKSKIIIAYNNNIIIYKYILH